MNGVSNIADLSMLQVNGISQIAKEIKELKDTPVKYLDDQCLHRNEETKEVEGVDKDVVM